MSYRVSRSMTSVIFSIHEGKTRLELHDLVEGRAMLIRSREIAFERQVDKARVEPRQLLITAAEPLHRAGAVIFQHHIRPYRKAVDHRLPFLALDACQFFYECTGCGTL